MYEKIKRVMISGVLGIMNTIVKSGITYSMKGSQKSTKNYIQKEASLVYIFF